MSEPALVCITTGERYSTDEPRWCSASGGLLDLEWTPLFDPEKIRWRPPSLWRYREALPIRDDRNIVSLGEGFTPLVPFRVAGRELLVKLDYLFPTGSYKDRGASVLISKVKELGIRHVVQDSSGNAGCAVAAYAALAGISCEIFVPESTSEAKLTQIRLAGAELHRVPGNREATARAAFVRAQDVYYASHCWNPYFLQGTRTFAFEVWEQLSWKAPGTVIVPAGNGTLLLGAWLGFRELLAAGFVDRMPALVAVQSAACAPIAEAVLRPGSRTLPAISPGHTIAEGIAIAEPVRWQAMVRAVQESGGSVITVDDRQIIDALKQMCGRGYYIEPTAAAAIAGTVKFLGESDAREPIVTVITGHGLKATEKMTALL